jgi:hypothetical protein
VSLSAVDRKPISGAETMTARQVTRLLAVQHFGYRDMVCVPRCHFAGAEADLLVLRPSGWLEEIEVKVSLADYRREFKTKADKHERLQNGKPHYRARYEFDEFPFDPENPKHVATICDAMDRVVAYEDWTAPVPHLVRRFWFAMPQELADRLRAEIPEHAGLISVALGYIRVLKQAPNLKVTRKLTDAERVDLMRLAYLRFWDVEAKELVEEGGSKDE